MRRSSPARDWWTPIGILLLLASFGIGGALLGPKLDQDRRNAWPGIAGGAVDIATVLPLPRPLVDFQLTERSGRTVSRSDLAGRFLVVNFVFSSCSLSCLAINDRMAELQRRLADAPDVQLVSFTVDPRTDSPDVLAAFARRFQADANRWLFLTGEKADVYRVIESSFIAQHPDLAQLIPGGFVGTDRVLLVDPAGTVCAAFNGGGKHVVAEVAGEIERQRAKAQAL